MSRYLFRDRDTSAASPSSSSDAARDPGRRSATQAMVPRGGGGQALPEELRAELEPALGQDLGGVRVHTGAASADSARALDARAYAFGQDIHFGAGEYAPGSDTGRELIAHEVAHTVQQRGASDAPAPALAPIEVSQPGDAMEREAEAFAISFGSERPAAVSAGAASSISRALIQRAPTGEPPPGRQADAKPVDGKGERNAHIANHLLSAWQSLQSANEQMGAFEDIVEALIQTAVDGKQEEADARAEMAELRKAIKEKGKPNVFRILCDLSIAVVGIATGVGGVIAAGADLLKKVSAFNGIAGAVNNVSKVPFGGTDMSVEERMADNLNRLDGRLARVNDALLQTLTLSGVLARSMVSDNLGEALVSVSGAANLMAIDPGAVGDVAADLRRVASSARTIEQRMIRVTALLGASTELGPERVAHGTEDRGLVEFMAARAQAGELGQFRLRGPESTTEISGFQWEPTPRGLLSVVHARQCSDRFGFRLDGGARWFGRLLEFGLAPGAKADPDAEGEVVLAVDQYLALDRAFSPLGLKHDPSAWLSILLPTLLEPVQVLGSPFMFWENPTFAALYGNELRAPGGRPVIGLRLADRGGEIVQPSWLRFPEVNPFSGEGWSNDEPVGE